MGVYADSSADPFDDPKVETIVELLTLIWEALSASLALFLLQMPLQSP
jgi:hypothetical protein